LSVARRLRRERLPTALPRLVGKATMNRLTQIKQQQQMNQRELEMGLSGGASWHDQYKDSAYVYVGGFPYDLTEGDLIAVMSQ